MLAAMQLVRSTLTIILVCAFALGCKQQTPMVYVLDGSQKVTLKVSASATQVKAGETYIPCNIFPGKLVNANGWCKVWVKRP